LIYSPNIVPKIIDKVLVEPVYFLQYKWLDSTRLFHYSTPVTLPSPNRLIPKIRWVYFSHYMVDLNNDKFIFFPSQETKRTTAKRIPYFLLFFSLHFCYPIYCYYNITVLYVYTLSSTKRCTCLWFYTSFFPLYDIKQIGNPIKEKWKR